VPKHWEDQVAKFIHLLELLKKELSSSIPWPGEGKNAQLHVSLATTKNIQAPTNSSINRRRKGERWSSMEGEKGVSPDVYGEIP